MYSMKGCENFLLMVLHAHVVAAGKEILSATPYDSVENLAKEIALQFIVFEPDVDVMITIFVGFAGVEYCAFMAWI